jgi:hypothetical protein
MRGGPLSSADSAVPQVRRFLPIVIAECSGYALEPSLAGWTI